MNRKDKALDALLDAGEDLSFETFQPLIREYLAAVAEEIDAEEIDAEDRARCRLSNFDRYGGGNPKHRYPK